MLTSEPKLKTKAEDFLVSEVLFLQNQLSINNNSSRYCYYRMIKKGYTTFESIDHISIFFCIDNKIIAHAGLKDEDGISEQYISIPVMLPIDKVVDFNCKYQEQEEHYLALQFYGKSPHPLYVGDLLGNHFSIVVRNLEEQLANYIANQTKHAYTFINYYGSQRFGLPSQPKTTHLIGEHIIKQNYDEALLLLSQQCSEIGMQARDYLQKSRPAQQFIAKLSPQLSAFYQSSYYSHLWNNALNQLLIQSGKKTVDYNDAGISYMFLTETVGELQGPNFLPYIRVKATNEGFENINLSRQVLVQLNLTCHNYYADPYHSGKFACEVSFFLPSGCYATVALYQFINHLQKIPMAEMCVEELL